MNIVYQNNILILANDFNKKVKLFVILHVRIKPCSHVEWTAYNLPEHVRRESACNLKPPQGGFFCYQNNVFYKALL